MGPDGPVEKICRPGDKCGFDAYGDIAKYETDLEFDYPGESMGRIRETDVIWHKNNRPKVIFGVENGTDKTWAFGRDSNLKKDVTKIILIPKAREQLLVVKASEPMNNRYLGACTRGCSYAMGTLNHPI